MATVIITSIKVKPRALPERWNDGMWFIPWRVVQDAAQRSPEEDLYRLIDRWYRRREQRLEPGIGDAM
jgi:hypothetical protein